MSSPVTVLLHVLEPVNVRNVLRSGTFDLLRADPSVRTVILSPLAGDPRFVEEFGGDRTAIEHAPWYRLTALQRRLESFALERYVRLRPTRALAARWARGENVGTRRYRRIVGAVKAAVARVPIAPERAIALADRMVPPASYASVFAQHRPDVVAIATGWQIGDIPWYVGARRNGVPCMAIDINWDSFESKAGVIRGANELLVWSEHLRAKALARTGYMPDQVHVTGAPQFDIYRDRSRARPREEFLRGLGFAADARLITLATVLNSPHDPARLRLLHRALTDGQFGDRAHLLVRVYPSDRPERWEPFRGLSRMRIEWPFGAGPGLAHLGETRADMQHKLDTLIHSDVIVNVNSTFALEAMLVDTPVVMVAFDGEGGFLPYERSDARFLDYEHIADLVATGGVRVAHAADELLIGVRAYLDDRTSDRDGRARARALAGPDDGRAAERAADLLVRAAARHAAGARHL